MLCFLYCITSSSYSKEDLSFWQLWKIINVTWILERCIGTVGEGLLRTRISSFYNRLRPLTQAPLLYGDNVQAHSFCQSMILPKYSFPFFLENSFGVHYLPGREVSKLLEHAFFCFAIQPWHLTFECFERFAAAGKASVKSGDQAIGCRFWWPFYTMQRFVTPVSQCVTRRVSQTVGSCNTGLLQLFNVYSII